MMEACDPVGLVHHLFQTIIHFVAGAACDGALDVVLGRGGLPLSIAVTSLGFIAGSGPPIWTAEMIDLSSLENSLPRRLSVTPLACLILAQCECFAMWKV